MAREEDPPPQLRHTDVRARGSRRHRSLLGLLAVALGVAPVRGRAAQTLDCTYDRCALRIGLGGVARGLAAKPAGAGGFVPRVPALDSAEADIRRHYAASQTAYKRYWAFGLLSVGGAIASMNYYEHHLYHDWRASAGIGLPLATVGLTWAGVATATRGEDHLRQAIWLYNRRFARPTDSLPASCPYDRCALRLQPRTWSTRIVQGVDATPIGGLEPPIALFTLAGDSARTHYEAFRAAYRQAQLQRRVGLGAYLVAGLLAALSRPQAAHVAAWGFAFVGYAAAHGSGYSCAEAQANLDQAIWFYNRVLPTTP